MDTLISVLHVATAVFIIGPMAILPMTAMRAIRAGNGAQVAVLAKSTTVFSWLSLLVFVFGFGAMSLAPEEYELTVATPWILWSIILYVVAFALSLFVVVPAMKRAAAALNETDAASGVTARDAGYPAIAAGSGIVALLLVAVVVLMVWKP
ncbi:DUF2269 family protein [Agromyces sp. Marseille-Q5079]|uniref:DUF2269 family protein n=1 Tax=Agromyces sp. Marseille-Q5079 TaxID=3439059 RepID=UPI003D9C96BF